MTMRQMRYGIVIGLGAFLLFSVEPMAAKQLLPVLGGSSAVWLTCLFFFQAMLLLAYGYVAWARGTMLLGHWAELQVGLLCVASLPLLMGGFGVGVGTVRHPALLIFVVLTRSIGVPFFVLGTTSPLLQAWIAMSEKRSVPYGLFALSNVTSLAALLAYPALIEPHMTLHAQRTAWACGFALYAVLSGWIAFEMRGERAAAAAEDVVAGVAVSSERKLLWFLLPAVAAMQLAAVTSHLTENVAAIPLLWVIPLAVYLLSFVVAFEFPGIYRRGLVVRVLAVLLASLGYLLSKTGVGLPLQMAIGFFVAELFCACWFLHAELYGLRPMGSRAATEFYLWIAAGGAAGTFLVAVMSPLMFRSNYDVPLAFALTAVAALAVTWGNGWAQRMLWGVGTVLGFTLVVLLHRQYQHDAIVRERNFYGSLRVRETHTPPQAVTARTLMNGTIRHGMQWFGGDFRKTPTTYYAEDSGVGLAMRLCCGDRPRRVGVVGLGAGTLAAYGRAGDVMEFYEINPMVEQVAREVFTFMRDTKARVTVMPGDARVSLAGQPPQGFDVLVVDAFLGDAIPVHLLTREAMDLYRRHLAPGGMVAFHVSNQYLNLEPVVAKLAESSGMQARLVSTPGREWVGEFAANWVLVTERGSFFALPEVEERAVAIPGVAKMRVWTDDYSSLLPVVRWRR